MFKLNEYWLICDLLKKIKHKNIFHGKYGTQNRCEKNVIVNCYLCIVFGPILVEQNNCCKKCK